MVRTICAPAAGKLLQVLSARRRARVQRTAPSHTQRRLNPTPPATYPRTRRYLHPGRSLPGKRCDTATLAQPPPVRVSARRPE